MVTHKHQLQREPDEQPRALPECRLGRWRGVGIDSDKTGPLLIPDQRRLLDALMDQAAHAIVGVAQLGTPRHPMVPGLRPGQNLTSYRYRLITPVGAGIVNRNRAPCDTCPVAHSRPPWASMIERQMESPMPMPFGFVV